MLTGAIIAGPADRSDLLEKRARRHALQSCFECFEARDGQAS